MSSRPVATSGPVLIVGSGFLGASLRLILRDAGVDVYLHDTSPTALRPAQDIGAGAPLLDITDPPPSLVVIAVPPDVADLCILDALRTLPSAIVTDVASVKSAVVNGVLTTLAAAQQEGFAARYVGSHPVAGRESSGAGAADMNLFYDRPWVVVAHEHSAPQAVLTVRMFVGDVGAVPVEMDARTHDDLVALVPRVPQLVPSLPAARLAEARSESLGLVGQGVRDTTRIAASDPRLWMATLAGNAGPVAEALEPLRTDLDDLLAHLKVAAQCGPLRGGSVGAVNKVVETGNHEVSCLPDKHDGAPKRYALLEVLIPDKPGELGRLFTRLGEIGINIGDLPLKHSAGQAVDLARIMVDPGHLNEAEKELKRRGWRLITNAVRALAAKWVRAGKDNRKMNDEECREAIRRNGITTAIDDPTGSGKSTISRFLVMRLGIGYLDTGAMYRSLTWYVLEQGLDLDDHESVVEAANRMPLVMNPDLVSPSHFVDGVGITRAICEPRIALAIPTVSTNLLVCKWMAFEQRRGMMGARESGSEMITEGRDITTMVCPDADVRVLLLADEEERLRCRTLGLHGEATPELMESMRKQITKHDTADATVSEFMTPAEGVEVVDSSGLGIGGVAEEIPALVDRNLQSRAVI